MVECLARNGIRSATYDVDPAARDRAAAVDNVSVAADLAGAVREADVVFTCLPNDAVVLEIYLGDGGIGQGVAEGAVTIDCSTVSPQATRKVHGALAERGVSHLDASMLGSIPQAETGEIGFVVGGDPAAFERAAPLLDILGRFRTYAGPSGAANQVKLIHQTLVAANAVAVAEAVALCLATGTDLDCFYDVVCNGGGFAYSRYFEKRVPRMRSGDFGPLFMLHLMKKDAALARDLAGSAGAEAPLLEQVVARLEAACERGWGEEDFSAVAHLYEEAIGRGFAEREAG